LLAPALAGAGGLRERLRATVATTADRGPATRWAVALAASALLIVGGPAMLVELAPTRQVLQELMHDSRWESRAFAVLGLAPRPDSIAVARAAARMDREPMVRAWAAYAVSQQMPAAREAAAALHILD